MTQKRSGPALAAVGWPALANKTRVGPYANARPGTISGDFVGDELLLAVEVCLARRRIEEG